MHRSGVWVMIQLSTGALVELLSPKGGGRWGGGGKRTSAPSVEWALLLFLIHAGRGPRRELFKRRGEGGLFV